jgi:hypothetical protein
MNDSNSPSVVQEEEEAAVAAVEEAEEAEEHQRHPNSQYPLQQTLKPWEDFPKSSTETAPGLMTSLKK